MSTGKGTKRRTYSITVMLALAIGGLVFIGVASVLGLGLRSAQQNTFSLLQGRSNDAVSNLILRVGQELAPPVEQIRFLHDLIAFGDLDYRDQTRMADLLSGALAGAPQVFGVTFLYADMTLLAVTRQDRAAVVRMGSFSSNPLVIRATQGYAEKSGVFWGELLPAPDATNSTLINLRMPVRRDGEYLGLLVAVVSISRLSSFVETLAMKNGSEAFILFGTQPKTI